MRIGIVGLGLMGASAAKELSYMGHDLYGSDIDCAVVDKAIFDRTIAHTLTINNAKQLDIIIIAVYSHVASNVLQEYVPLLKSGCIVIDLAGNKRNIVSKMTELSRKYIDIKFAGGHPMAGREVSGYAASKQGLFLGARMLLVPINLDDESYTILEKIFNDMGVGKVIITSADEHDANIAYTSQLAHVLSNAYIKSPRAATYHNYSAGSFRDLTRVAGLNVPMWSELMIENRDNLINEIDILIDNLNAVKCALIANDKNKLSQELALGDAIKKNLNLKPLEL